MIPKKPALLGAVASVTLFALYLVIVILSTPQFTPAVAVTLSLRFNGAIMIAISGGVGLQVFLMLYNRSLACQIKGAGTTSVSGSTFTTFTSFFALSNVGCCGLFPLYISLIFGTGLAGALVQYSQILTTVGLGVMSITVIFMIRSVRKNQAANRLIYEQG